MSWDSIDKKTPRAPKLPGPIKPKKIPGSPTRPEWPIVTDEDIISGVCDTANKFRNQLALLTQRVGMEAWMAIDPDDLDTIKRLLEWKYVGKNDGKDAGTQLRKTVELPSDAPF